MIVGLSRPKEGVFSSEPPDNWTIVQGDPSMRTWIEFQSTDKSIVTGTWKSTIGTWRSVNTAYHEYVYLVAGIMELTPDGGSAVRVSAGDAFTVEAGFSGTWKIVEDVSKRFLLRLA